MTRLLALCFAALFGLVACDDTAVSTAGVQAKDQTIVPTSRASARSFVAVTRQMEPVIERECRARTRGANCDFKIVVDTRANQPANAYQTVDQLGRPIIAFTSKLIADARNDNELAFVLGHEAAHHILGHIDRQRENALAGAVIFAGLARVAGGDSGAVQSAQDLGLQVGARSYSKSHELEADSLGTVLTMRSGYDAVAGARFFNRIPDPGDKFLGTHPPNAQRVKTVQQTAAKVRAGQL